MRRSRLLAAAVAVLAAAGCGTKAGSAPADIPPGDAAAKLQFRADAVDGTRFDGSSLAGRDAVLWFWAPWCGTCRAEAPYVAAAQAEHGKKVAFVGVAGLGPVQDMRSFVDDYGVDAFPHVADLDGSVWQRFGVVQQPAYAFVDDDGSVQVVIGALGEDELADRLADLMAR